MSDKPTETVAELKNEIPTFEEFMKTYENDENLNYADLNDSDIGTQKSYGPTTYGDLVYHEGSERTLTFRLKVEIENFAPSLSLSETFNSPEEALRAML